MSNPNRYQGYYQPQQPTYPALNRQQVFQYGQQPPVLEQQQQPWRSHGQVGGQPQTQIVITHSTTSTTHSHRGSRYQQQQQPPPPPMVNYAPPVYQPTIPAQQSQNAPVQQPQLQQHPAIDYDSMMAEIQRPQPQQSTIDYDSLIVEVPPAPPAAHTSSSQSTTSSRTQTLVYPGSNKGGEARKAAEARGQLTQHEDRVQTMIASMAICPSKYKWYPVDGDYLCACGNHAIEQAEIDKWCEAPSHRPAVKSVNTFHVPNARFYCNGNQRLALLHPPAVDFWQPMHRVHARFVQQSAARGYIPITSSCECFRRIMGTHSCAQLTGVSDAVMDKHLNDNSYSGPGQDFGIGPRFNR
ncbi:hypothetical protein LTR36_007843 [Oleoguttula mirabilis]|uniref:Uncharacterized protein n=1 Tax=Oleoguttula mirabilis TaxID=1507867 RepID=A0AAV9J9V4_9PEZI|nr:hypothetical protein LTR36_007843 [Oleoguttula mirabilis]